MKIGKNLLLSFFSCLFVVVGSLGMSNSLESVSKKGCFFKSDCPPKFKCVSLKGEARGTCQEDLTPEPPLIEEENKETQQTICRYHSECLKGNICVKAEGNVTGVCQSDPLADEFLGNESEFPTETDQTRCTFNTDCKTGSFCNKAFGQLTGTCIEPNILEEEEEEEKEKSIFDKERMRKQCLIDADCGLKGVCVTVKSSVWGECRDKSDPLQLLAP